MQSQTMFFAEFVAANRAAPAWGITAARRWTTRTAS